MLRRVRVELGRVLRYLRPHLLFLKLPDVELLVAVLEHVDAFRDLHALLGRSTHGHLPQPADVGLLEVCHVS